jgi:hypothetical protein
MKRKFRPLWQSSNPELLENERGFLFHYTFFSGGSLINIDVGCKPKTKLRGFGPRENTFLTKEEYYILIHIRRPPLWSSGQSS